MRTSHRSHSPSARARGETPPERPASYPAAGPSWIAFIRFVSIEMPGPIVVETVRLITYLPFAADGFARRTSSTTVR